MYPQIHVCSAGVWNPVFVCAKQVLCQLLNYSLSLRVYLSHIPLMPQSRDTSLRRYQAIIGGCDARIYEVQDTARKKTQGCLLLHVIQLCNCNSYLENRKVVGGGAGTWSPAERNLFVETVLSLLVLGQIDTVS